MELVTLVSALVWKLTGLFKLIVQRNLVEEPCGGNARNDSPPFITKKDRPHQEIDSSETCCDPYPIDDANVQEFDPGLFG
jgi:hypothetical protein